MKKILKKVKNFVYNFFRKLFYLFPIKKNKILFSYFFGDGYSDNPKYITEELLKRNSKIKIIWLLKDTRQELPCKIKKIKFDSIRAIYQYSTSKVIVQNIRNAHLNKKRKNQIYLQTWHGSMALKYIEKECENELSKNYIEQAKYDGNICDGIIADSKLQEGIYIKSFWLNKKTEILKFGAPRNDLLINGANNLELINNVRNSLNCNNSDYLILYAPTFRDDNSTEGYILEYEKILKSFEQITKKNCKILVKFHPNVKKCKELINYNEQVIDVTSYDDIQELTLSSDCVISDYSSIIFDFLLLKKPIFLYCNDIENYVKLRGLSERYYDLPFIKSKSYNDLISNILNFSEDTYYKNIDEYNKNYPNYNDGRASIKTVNWILNKINK